MLITEVAPVPMSDPETLESVGRPRRGETESERLLFRCRS